MADVIEIRTIEELSSYRLVWDALLAETPRATYFHTYDWLENFLRHDQSTGRQQVVKLRVLLVRAAGKPVGIVPLCVMQKPHRLGSVQVLTYPVDDWAPFYSPIGRSQTATLTLAMRHLAQTPRDWDEIDLPWIAGETTDRGRTRRAMQNVGLATRQSEYGVTSIIDTSAGWDGYLAAITKKSRHELRRNLRRAELESEPWGGLKFVRHRPDPRRAGDGAARWDLYGQCEQVAAASWQATSAAGNTLCHPDYQEFYRDSHASATRLGMSDMCLLKLGGRPVAFFYSYQHDGQVMGLRMGYDPSAPLPGIGTTLMATMIRDSCHRGDLAIDLGLGNQKFKRRLRTVAEPIARLTHTPRTAWRPQLVRASQWLRQRVAL